ncbi:MAG TPA: ABC transporter ATP-binding protein [Clostridiales bacterium]|nr:ABC transporter ATP-binding protein [Clostridiales bacterium]
MSDNVLEIKGITKRFGGLTALSKLDLEVEHGSIHAIIGPNGSGKTTFFNVITGLYVPDEGSVIFCGKDVTGTVPYKMARLGMGRTFQTIFLFKQMTVLENVLIGLQSESEYKLINNMIMTPKRKLYEKELHDKAYELLTFVGLYDQRNDIACNLPYGKQRLLEVARAMGINPKIILLDEPAAGMNPQETSELIERVKNIRDKYNMTVLIIEHDMKLVMQLADIITCLDHGSVIACGNPKIVTKDSKVVEAYLGIVGERDTIEYKKAD